MAMNGHLETVQYLWQYGTGKLDTGLAVTFELRAHGAMCFSEASAYGATAYIWPADYTNTEKLMYGAREYLAYLGYGAMRLF